MGKDFKIATASKKAPLGMVPLRALKGVARVLQYGARKYAPGNFLEASLVNGAGERYASAALRHLSDMQDLNGLFTLEGLGEIDDESGLPQLDHVLTGLIMLRAILVKEGVLDSDPGEANEPERDIDSILIQHGVDPESDSVEFMREANYNPTIVYTPDTVVEDEAEDLGPYRPHRGHVGYRSPEDM